MKKFLIIIIIIISSIFFISNSHEYKTIKDEPISIQDTSQKQIIKNQNTVKRDTIKNKLSESERKKLEYHEYEKKQHQINKNLNKMDENIQTVEKQKIVMDSVLLKRKIKK